MLDYQAWVHRAIEYVNAIPRLPGEFGISGSVQPPIDALKVDRLAERCRLPIPDSLCRLPSIGPSQGLLGLG